MTKIKNLICLPFYKKMKLFSLFVSVHFFRKYDIMKKLTLKLVLNVLKILKHFQFILKTKAVHAPVLHNSQKLRSNKICMLKISIT